VLVGDRAEGSHRKGAKDAKETAKGANGCQSSIGSGSDPSACLANSAVDFSEITTLHKNRLAPLAPRVLAGGERGGGVRGLTARKALW
jgi:hypothetical protein